MHEESVVYVNFTLGGMPVSSAIAIHLIVLCTVQAAVHDTSVSGRCIFCRAERCVCYLSSYCSLTETLIQASEGRGQETRLARAAIKTQLVPLRIGSQLLGYETSIVEAGGLWIISQVIVRSDI